MNAEWFTAIALPVSVAEDADAHVTVFIAPTLRPDHDGAVLSEFELFRDWGDVVAAGVEVTLVDQLGEFAADVDLSGHDQALWGKAFGPTTPVLANLVPEWQQRDWRTFAAKDCSDIAKAVHLATVATDPVTPVAPLAHPLTQGVLGVAQQAGALTLAEGHDRRHPVPVYDESHLTRFLDDSLRRGRDGAWTTPEARPGSAGGAGADPTSSVLDALRQLHLARRFYERPESQAAEQKLKDPPDKVAQLPSPEPEFHERVAAAGDHPTFLRRLGLLLPVRTDPARLRRSRWLAAVVRTRVADGACRSPRLAVHALRDDSFVSVPNPDDPAIWADGALALGDAAVFDVVDVDPDGSAIKAERFLTTVPRLAIAQLQKMPADAASPAMRASGLTVTRRQQAGRALTQLDRQQGYQGALEVAAPPADLPLLHTQDVTRGVRVEVWDSVSRVWHSLHSRRSTLLVNGATVYTDDLNDGFIQGTSATETREVPDSAIHVHEAMFGWEGWSLSAPRPGRRIRPVVSDAPGGGSQITETAETTPTSPMPGEKPPHPFVFTHRFAEGTLPRLRFGRDYSFRAWAVDLGGNVRTHHVGPRPPALEAIAASALGVAPLSDRALSRRLASASARDVPALASAFTAAAAAAPTAAEVEEARLLDLGFDDLDDGGGAGPPGRGRRWRPRRTAAPRCRSGPAIACSRRSPPPTCTPSCSARPSAALPPTRSARWMRASRPCATSASGGPRPDACWPSRRSPQMASGLVRRQSGRRSARPRRGEPSSGARCSPTSTPRVTSSPGTSPTCSAGHGRSTPPGRSSATRPPRSRRRGRSCGGTRSRPRWSFPSRRSPRVSRCASSWSVRE